MSKRLAILLAVAAVLAVLTGLKQFVLTPPGEDAASAPVVRPAARPVAPARSPSVAQKDFLPPLSGYGAIWTRPIFSPSRRQAAVVAGPRTPVGTARASDQPPALKIVGVAISPHGSAALVRAPGSPVKRQYAGDVVDGWTIEKIEPQNVTVSRDGERWQLPVGATQ